MPDFINNSLQMCQIDSLQVFTFGNPEILNQPLLALFCSQNFPGECLLPAYDLAVNLRQMQTAVIGGFHSQIEKDVLRILLRGSQPLVMCLARSLVSYRIPAALKPALGQGRLLLLSPFSGKNTARITRVQADIRNRLIATLVERIVVLYAHPGGKIYSMCQEWLAAGKKVYALPIPSNQHLFSSGVLPWED